MIEKLRTTTQEETAVAITLSNAYRQADEMFTAAQNGPHDTRALEFAQIIGHLQGTIQIAVICLGYKAPQHKDRDF